MIMEIIIPKLIFGVMFMIFSEVLLWIIAAVFLIGVVMTLETRLPSVVGLFFVCVTSIFFLYYFSFFRYLALCVMFGVLSLIAIRYLIAAFRQG